MFLLLLFLFSSAEAAYLSASLAEWDFISAHDVPNKIASSSIDLNKLARQEWASLVRKCPQLPSFPRIQIRYDYNYENTTILAYASQTLHLSSKKVWVSTLYEAMNRNSTFTSVDYDMKIGVNPTPPNGWYYNESNCSCRDISYRFDLRSVVRHELLHGLILASSVRLEDEWKVGYNFQGNPDLCYPRLFDTKIRTEDNESLVDGCNVSNATAKKLFINGVPLYNPARFRSGSSLSHHDIQNNLMYYSMPPQTCLDVGEYEIALLQAMDIQCNLTNTSCLSKGMKIETTYSMSVIIILTILFLF